MYLDTWERLREIEVERADLHVKLAQLAAEEVRLQQDIDGYYRPPLSPREEKVS